MGKSDRYKGLSLLLCLFITAVPSAVRADSSFSLTINDVSSLDEAWPLLGGVPFPEGELRNVDKIRIRDSAGKPVAAQLDVTARWPDGSIRWVLAGMNASPQGHYVVEFGDGVSAAKIESPLRISDDGKRGMTIDTGAAVYHFRADGLLPDRAAVGGVPFFANAAGGAYLLDNHGRLGRVAGDAADITSVLHKHGRGRVVVERAGWYVTADGERLARARVFFYFMAGSPYLKITHSLIFTEDTNEVWVRDYGFEFPAGEAAESVVFALASSVEAEDVRVPENFNPRPHHHYDLAELSNPGYRREWELVTVVPAGDEVYMLQDEYPHHIERDASRAVIARVTPQHAALSAEGQIASGSLWVHDWEIESAVAGDWADVRYGDHAVTVVMPWLAQRFPKEIAVDDNGIRVAFWSGRSGRELDFRPVTLVNEYWKRWSNQGGVREDRGPVAAAKLAAESTNAQGSARTHDLWLLPRQGALSDEQVSARATAAARPPLLLADPEWLAATEAIGFPMRQYDPVNFPVEEAVLVDYWNGMMANYTQLTATGFIDWGRNVYLRGPGSPFFRVANLVDYGLRRHSWNLYARSGFRPYWEYASRFNRFSGDWTVAHWPVRGRVDGAITRGDGSRPYHWGADGMSMWGGSTGTGVTQWLLEYYLQGDEYTANLLRRIGEAYKAIWNDDELALRAASADGVYYQVALLAGLYTLTGDVDFKEMAGKLWHELRDPDHPTGRSDKKRFGIYYKMGRDMVSLYDYYRATGDETAKDAILRNLEYKYRFHHLLDNLSFAPRDGFGSQHYSTFLYSVAYLWTERPVFLNIVNRLIERTRNGPDGYIIVDQMNPFLGVPVALKVLYEADQELIAPYPLMDIKGEGPLRITKEAGMPVTVEFFVAMADHIDGETPATVVVSHTQTGGARGVEVESEIMFQSAGNRQDLSRRSVRVRIDGNAPAGEYLFTFPNAARVIMLTGGLPR